MSNHLNFITNLENLHFLSLVFYSLLVVGDLLNSFFLKEINHFVYNLFFGLLLMDIKIKLE